MKRNAAYKVLSILAAAVLVFSGVAFGNKAEAETVIVTSPFTEAIAKVHDSVVGINNYQMVTSYSYSYGFGFGGRASTTEKLYGSGSATVIDERGYVLTNNHVVDGASKVTVTISGDEEIELNAAVVATNPDMDIAIVYCPELGLPAVTLGDSDALMVGDWAICIGNPIGFTGTTTVGIISALGREISSDGYDKYGRKTNIINTMIQTDAAINSGNSGGGMFNVSGELVGIPSLKYSGSYYSTGASIEGMAMAIPINGCKELIEKVLSGEIETPEVEPTKRAPNESGLITAGTPRLGVTISNMNTSNAAVADHILPAGAYVTAVEEGSGAADAGIQVADIIVEVNGTIITTVTELKAELADCVDGDKVTLVVYRVPGLATITSVEDIPDGEYLTLEVEMRVLDDQKQ